MSANASLDAREIITPANEAQACEAVREARAAGRPLRITGGGSRPGLGRPVEAQATLSASGLCGVTTYQPAELVIAARAGTPVAEIEAALARQGQSLPFEPMDHRALYGAGGEPTIGAVAACNLSGPRRIKAGAARDCLLGVRFVNGRGEAIKSGGRVMKNVTGLDLVKLSAGAHGTLGFLTEVTFRVLPSPTRAGGLVCEGLDDARAIEAMSAALATPFEVSAAAHLPGPAPRTCLRVEHFPNSVDYRLGELASRLSRFGAWRRIDEDETISMWRDIRDARPLAHARADEHFLWRASLPPGRAAAFVAGLADQGFARRWFYDWGGGLVWLASVGEEYACAAIRRAAMDASGHALLARAPDEDRARLDVFQPPAPAIMALTRRVKASFDPDGILNFGRMYAGV